MMRASVALAALSAAALRAAGTAAAQDQPIRPSTSRSIPRGVDLVNGGFNFNVTEVEIGQPEQGGRDPTAA